MEKHSEIVWFFHRSCTLWLENFRSLKLISGFQAIQRKCKLNGRSYFGCDYTISATILKNQRIEENRGIFAHVWNTGGDNEMSNNVDCAV